MDKRWLHYRDKNKYYIGWFSITVFADYTDFADESSDMLILRDNSRRDIVEVIHDDSEQSGT